MTYIEKGCQASLFSICHIEKGCQASLSGLDSMHDVKFHHCKTFPENIQGRWEKRGLNHD